MVFLYTTIAVDIHHLELLALRFTNQPFAVRGCSGLILACSFCYASYDFNLSSFCLFNAAALTDFSTPVCGECGGCAGASGIGTSEKSS